MEKKIDQSYELMIGNELSEGEREGETETKTEKERERERERERENMITWKMNTITGCR